MGVSVVSMLTLSCGLVAAPPSARAKSLEETTSVLEMVDDDAALQEVGICVEQKIDRSAPMPPLLFRSSHSPTLAVSLGAKFLLGLSSSGSSSCGSQLRR